MERASPLPAWVAKRDGRLEPFDADKISRSLFAATEALGKADAFLARELADGAVHFLSAEYSSTTPTTAQVAELVVKVVRELGQPALAQAYDRYVKQVPAEDSAAIEIAESRSTAPMLISENIHNCSSPAALERWLARSQLSDFSLREVFTRDLAQAHEEGLLVLRGLGAPTELHALSLEEVPADADLVASLSSARQLAGQSISFDSPEFLPFAGPIFQHGGPNSWLKLLGITTELVGLNATINLNIGSPPPWAKGLGEGPLFGAPPERNRPGGQTNAVESWLPATPAEFSSTIRIHWHLRESDFAPEQKTRLAALARRASAGWPVTFVFDRPRRPISLGEGLDRQHLAVLMVVGLHLPKLREQPGVAGDADAFLKKLASLARLALSAGVQKRDYLRRFITRRPGLQRGFLLDRARLVVVPVGLDAVVREYAGRSFTAGGAALDFGRRIVRRLREILEHDGRATHLETCLDSAENFSLEPVGNESMSPERVAGLTAWDPKEPRRQIKAAGALHDIVGRGTAVVLMPQDTSLHPSRIDELLRFALQETQVTQLQFVPTGTARQTIAKWDVD